jgi:hypothetical protein
MSKPIAFIAHFFLALSFELVYAMYYSFFKHVAREKIMNQVDDVFGEFGESIANVEQAVEEKAAEDEGESRKRAKFYVVDVIKCLNSVKELREYLENHDEINRDKLVIKGHELEIKRKVVYTI